MVTNPKVDGVLIFEVHFSDEPLVCPVISKFFQIGAVPEEIPPKN
jgi:hypothetical protein